MLQGNLNEIKKGYGRINLHLKTEKDAFSYIRAAGIALLSYVENDYNLKVTNEKQANLLLAELIANNVPIVTFDLREPSLHEIFVEKVGTEHEDL